MKPSDYIRKGWCQGATALDAGGVIVSASDPLACRWCASGSVIAAFGESVKAGNVVWNLTSYLVQSVPAWNDNKDRTQDEVIDVLEANGL